MNTALKTIVFAVILSLVACAAPTAPASSTQAAETTARTAASKPLLKTAAGDFEIVTSRFVEEANGVKPGPGEKILLVFLAQPGGEKLDPQQFSLEAFSQAIHDVSQGEVHILGDDGSFTISTMAGWVGDEFAMGFLLPNTTRTYTLNWPGNNPLVLVP